MWAFQSAPIEFQSPTPPDFEPPQNYLGALKSSILRSTRDSAPGDYKCYDPETEVYLQAGHIQ